ANYDRFGHAGVNGAGGMGDGFSPFGSEGFGDIFDMFFGAARAGAAGAQQQRRNGPVRGSDLRYDVEISLEEAYHGTTRDITFRHLTRCGGDGQVVQTPCSACRGRGRVEQERALHVKIPAGVDDGSRIKITGSGEAGMRGGPDGDLYVYLTIAPHALFKRDGLDVLLDYPIAFPQAALGGEIRVPSLDDDVPLTLNPGTQSGSTYRLRGRGMPSVRGTARGDQLVTVHVVVPTKLSKRERELLEEYASAG